MTVSELIKALTHADISPDAQVCVAIDTEEMSRFADTQELLLYTTYDWDIEQVSWSMAQNPRRNVSIHLTGKINPTKY